MGFLNQNTTYLGNDITFPVVEGYCGSIGAAMAAIDGQMNDFALFEAALKYDFTEAMALKEDADLEPLQEASLKGMVDKIIEFLKKLGSKIQALFTGIMAKLDSYIKKDSKAFVEKYQKTLIGKDFKDMKAKYAEPVNGYVYNASPSFTLTINTKLDKDFDREETISKFLGTILSTNSCSAKDFRKELHDKMYKDEETKDDWTNSDFDTIGARLKNADKPIAELKKKNDSLQADIKKAIAAISKSKGQISDKYKVSGGSDVSGITSTWDSSYDADKKKYVTTTRKTAAEYSNANTEVVSSMQKHLSRTQEEATALQSAIMTYCSAVMNEAKWGLAQDRRVFAQAVAYHALKENANLAEAVGEVAEQECLTMFEEFEICA